MKKPKKTLKELSRLERLLSKQTAGSAKLLARRKKSDEENPVTAAFYDRIATHHAAALVDLSEIVHLSETLARQLVEAEAAKAAKKAAAARRESLKKEKARKLASGAVSADKPVARNGRPAAANGKLVAKRPTRRAAPKPANPQA